jgi:hypothetical protein
VGIQAFNILIENVETIIRSDAVPASNSIMEEATGFLRQHQLLGKACGDTLSLLHTEQKSRIQKAEQLVNALADSIK